MLGAAVGCMGMSHGEFCGLYFEEFEGIYKAWREMSDADERAAWERTRILATICIQPHLRKKITPGQLLPLPWDKKQQGTGPDGQQFTKEQCRARFEALVKRSGESHQSDSTVPGAI